MYDDIEDELQYYIKQYTIFEAYDLVAFLENEQDEIFWTFIINKAKINKKVAFNFYSKKGSQGKKEILKYKTSILDKFGKAIICIDSDFDYITEHIDINNNKYIFQTYTYSIENYSCYAKNLNSLYQKLLIGEESFDFEIFFREYSKIISKLLILDIVLKEEQTKINSFYKSESNMIKLMNNGAKLLENLENKITDKIKKIKLSFSIDLALIEKLKNKIEGDELIISNYTYLYVNGHIIFNLTEQILTTLQDNKHKRRLAELKISFKGERLSNKINELRNSKHDITTILKSNFDYCYDKNYCPSFNKIIDDIKQNLS